MEAYRSAVLTGDLGLRDRRRMFHQSVLELIEVFQEEGRHSHRRLPKVRFVSSPTARIFYGKTALDIDKLRRQPQKLAPATDTPLGVEISPVTASVAFSIEKP